MTKLELTKAAAKFVVGFGAATIVRTIAHNNVQPDDLPTKVAVTAGSLVLGSMVADLSTRYLEAKIDEAAAWYDENVKK